MSDKSAAATHGARVEDRLRLHAPHSDYEALMVEAANEIERKQAALDAVLVLCSREEDPCEYPSLALVSTRQVRDAIAESLRG